MDTRLTLEQARDRLDDWLQGLAHALDGAALPVETAAYLASAQRRVGETIADLDKATRHLNFDGPVQRLSAPRRGLAGATAVIDGHTGVLVS